MFEAHQVLSLNVEQGNTAICSVCTQWVIDLIKAKKHKSTETELNRACTHCGEIKEVEEFSFTNSTNTKRKSICKSCAKEKGREYYAQNKELVSTKAKARYIARKEAPKVNTYTQQNSDYSSCHQSSENCKQVCNFPGCDRPGTEINGRCVQHYYK